MSVMINKNLKAGNVLPPLQVLIHCLDEPSQIGGKEKQLLELQEKLSVLLTTEGKEEKPLKVDDICSSYLPKTGEFTNGVTPRYDSFFYICIYTVSHFMIMHSASVCLFTQMACVQFSTTGAKGVGWVLGITGSRKEI